MKGLKNYLSSLPVPNLKLIKKEQQKIACLEKNLAAEKLKQRRSDTRRKIEFGGLVIKSAMDVCNKSIILGALTHAVDMMEKDSNYKILFESIGDNLFLKSK